MNQQLHRLALELLVVSFLNLLFLHGFSLFTLSFRVRKIRGGSVGLIVLQIVLNQKLAQDVLRYLIERVEYLLSANAIPSKSLRFPKLVPEKQIDRFNRGNAIFWKVAFVIKENETQLI